MPSYPYPIQDWTQPNAYPTKANELEPHQWAWEFLRRNPDYQRLWDQFASLPDTMTCPDGYQTIKNGKWKGTPPKSFEFFRDGACWYADPPPLDGESTEEYDKRTGGRIMPFAHYLEERFHIINPEDPRNNHGTLNCDFLDLYDQAPPLGITNIIRPPPDYLSEIAWNCWKNDMETLTSNR